MIIQILFKGIFNSNKDAVLFGFVKKIFAHTKKIKNKFFHIKDAHKKV
jgi:hypothetical protein